MPEPVDKFCETCECKTPHLPGGDPLRMNCMNSHVAILKESTTEQGKCSFKSQCDTESTPYKEQFCGCYNEEQRLKAEQEELWIEAIKLYNKKEHSQDGRTLLMKQFTITKNQ